MSERTMTNGECVLTSLIMFMCGAIGCVFGHSFADAEWRQLIRDGRGPEILKMIEHEDEASKLSKNLGISKD